MYYNYNYLDQPYILKQHYILNYSIASSNIMQILLIMAILYIVNSSILLNPINSSCIDFPHADTFNVSSYYQLSSGWYQFKLPSFSMMLMDIDLRHLEQSINQPDITFLYKINITKAVNNQMPTQDIPIKVSSSNRQSLYVTEQILVVVYVQIVDKYQSYQYLLEESVSIEIIFGNYRVPEDISSFLIVVQNTQRISLPYNAPTIDPQFKGYFLRQIPQTRQVSRQFSLQSITSYWSTLNSIALPYFPYFSNCIQQSDNIYLNQIFESQTDCQLIQVNQTQPIQQFEFGSLPSADICVIGRQCIYDQVPDMNIQFPTWPILPSGSVLFSITRNKIPYQQYQIDRTFDSTELIKCRINESSGTNQTGQYPLKVIVNIQYYQQTQEIKTIVKCNVEYSLYVQSKQDFAYQLQINAIPMSHTNIMLAFGFQWYVYMIVFVIIGALSNLQNLILWFYHSLVSKKKQKSFRIKIYLRVVWQITKGTFIALFLFIALSFFVTILMNGKIFDTLLYDTSASLSNIPKVFWDSINTNYIQDYNSQTAANTRAGRTGLSFLIIGVFIIFYTSKYFIGCEKPKKRYDNYEILGRNFVPRQYNKGKFIFGTFFFIFMQFIFIYFAYSKLYSTNIWTFIFLMKIIQMIIQQITKSIYEDILLCLPLKVITDITAYMNTLSANNFYDFLFSFLIDVAITMIQKAYISQLQNIVVEKIQQKIDDFNTMYYNFIHDNQTNQGFNSNNQTQNEQNDEDDSENNQVVIVDYVKTHKHRDTNQDQIQLFEVQLKESFKSELQIQNEVQVSQQIQKLQKQLHDQLRLYKIHQNKQMEKKAQRNKSQNQKKVSKQSPQNKLQNIDVEEQQIQKSSSIFQLLLDNIVLIFTFFLQPFVILVFWISYDESGVLGGYGISYQVVILYILSAIVIAFFTIINVILIFHLLQCYLEIDFQDPIQKLLQRFRNRSIFWKASDQDINTGIGQTLRGADHYCLSWQFFFILTTYISSMILVMVGVSILMKLHYNPFEDIITFLMIPFWFFFIHLSIKIIEFLGFKFNIDGWAEFQGQYSNNRNAIADFSLKKQRKSSSSNADIMISISEQGFTNHNLIGKQNLSENQSNNSLFRKKISTGPFISAGSLDKSQLQSISDAEDNQVTETFLQTICQKLEEQFNNQQFCREYFGQFSNKQHLRNKIWQILQDEQDQLPQLPDQQTKIMMQLENNNQMINDRDSPTTKLQANNKNYDPAVIDLVTKWKNKVDEDIKYRHSIGKNSQQRVSQCSYCYKTWGLYFGPSKKKHVNYYSTNLYLQDRKAYKQRRGICLKCSKQIIDFQKKDV